MSEFTIPGLGWHRDLPDPRDFTSKHDAVVKILRELPEAPARPERVDLREYCGRVHDQRQLATSSVCACLGLVQYFERRTTGRVLEPSPLFVDHTARRWLGGSIDGGLALRPALKALLRFGLPPERLWPSIAEGRGREPDAFVYAAADRLAGATYFRLDQRDGRPEDTLENVKRFLAAGFVVAFGFPVSTSVDGEAEIPYPTIFDGLHGGQAVLAVGYDDTRRVRSDRGALLFANSWGSGWGDQGYGWLPYSYVREQLAADFWTLVTHQWLVSGELQRPG
jgi:C1A family cysteine protease